MSANILPKGAQSEMMGALLFAMKGECKCLSCIALGKMADSLIKTSTGAKSTGPTRK